MIPSYNSTIELERGTKVPSSKNHRMSIDNRITGHCDELEAMSQVIYKILNTERYQHLIYSWNYGIELLDLYGMPIDYVCSELKRRIEEALVQDDRIISVDNFEFDITMKKTISVRFTVNTIYGSIDGERMVNI